MAKYYNLAVRWLDLSSSLFWGVMLIVSLDIDYFFCVVFTDSISHGKKHHFGGKHIVCVLFEANPSEHPTSKHSLVKDERLWIIFGWIISHVEKKPVVVLEVD